MTIAHEKPAPNGGKDQARLNDGGDDDILVSILHKMMMKRNVHFVCASLASQMREIDNCGGRQQTH